MNSKHKAPIFSLFLLFTFTIYAQKTVKDTLDYEYIFGMAIKGEITPILNLRYITDL